MAVSITIAKHGVAYPSKSLAEKGGKYIHNITLTKDHDNGEIVGRGKFIELDRYEEGDATAFSAVIVDTAPNGNFYVEVKDPGDALIIRQVPVIEYEFNRDVKQEASFYNEKGDTVRGYETAKGDIWEMSASCFSEKVAVGDEVTGTNGKLAKKAAGGVSGGDESKG